MTLIHKLNQIFNFIADATWSLLGNPYLFLCLVSVIAGVVLVYLYGKVSNQKKISKIKRSIYAALLEVILFRHSGRLTLKAQARMFAMGGRYLALAIPPLLILMLPCVIVMAQLNRMVGYQPISAGQSSLVKVTSFNLDRLFNMQLIADGPSASVTKPVRVSTENSIYWRVDFKSDQAMQLILRSPNDSDTVIPLRSSWQVAGEAVASNIWWEALLYPTSLKVPEYIKQVSVTYNDAEYSLFGWKTHWIIYFFVLSLVSGIAASRLLKIEI